MIEQVGGRRPVCRAKYISRCCDGPVDVYNGRIAINPNNPADWSIPIVRRCALCGRDCEGYYPPGSKPEGT
jgi:hypothetical protein